MNLNTLFANTFCVSLVWMCLSVCLHVFCICYKINERMSFVLINAWFGNIFNANYLRVSCLMSEAMFLFFIYENYMMCPLQLFKSKSLLRLCFFKTVMLHHKNVVFGHGFAQQTEKNDALMTIQRNFRRLDGSFIRWLIHSIVCHFFCSLLFLSSFTSFIWHPNNIVLL